MSYTRLLYHVVLGTKRSERIITPEYERTLYMYIFTFIKGNDSRVFRIGGMPDHVHLLMSLHPTIAVSDFIRDLKTATSKFMKSHGEDFPSFDGWESEYYASTVSETEKDAVIRYISRQEEHHQHLCTRDEILRLCAENGIHVNEKYLG